LVVNQKLLYTLKRTSKENQTDPYPHTGKMDDNNNNISKSVKKKVVINELVKGQEAATKLKFLLQNHKNHPFGDGSLSSYKLAANVLRSFTEALSIISQPTGCDDFLNLLNYGENGLSFVVSGNNPPCDGIKKSSLPAKGGRGCYKRRLIILINYLLIS
jgi:hypothetical protein